jgi:hypothetical protein
MPIAIASGCAPEQERGILTRSPVLFQAPRPRSPPACSPSKTLVVFVPAYNNPRHRPPNPHERFVRDSQIPIGRARPTSPQPPRGFLLGRLSDAGPATRTTVLQGAGIRNPSPFLPFGDARYPPFGIVCSGLLGMNFLRIRLSLSLVPGDELIGDVFQVIADDLRLGANPQNIIADPLDQRCFPAGRDGAERVPCVTGDQTELGGFNAKLPRDVGVSLGRRLVALDAVRAEAPLEEIDNAAMLQLTGLNLKQIVREGE